MAKCKISHRPEVPLDYLLSDVGLDMLTNFGERDLTWRDMAEQLGTTPAQLKLFVEGHQEAHKALLDGLAVATRDVENKLLESIKGYDYEERTYETDDTGVERLTKRVIKHARPDTRAAFKWLENRAPERWSSDAPLISVTNNTLNVEDKRQAAQELIASIISDGEPSHEPSDADTEP